MTIITHLERTAASYPVFEEDQILTHEHLNTLSGYADYQIRLTRAKLLGVGIASGLRASLSGEAITLSEGVGITTDGDIVLVETKEVFHCYKAYDSSALGYRHLKHGDTPIETWQLIAGPKHHPEAIPLVEFATRTGKKLAEFVALIFIESHHEGRSLCSGSDCDSHGKMASSAAKVLLAHKGDIKDLKTAIPAPADVLANLDEIEIARAVVGPNITDVNGLANIYRSAANAILTALLARLQTLTGAHPTLERLLFEGLFESNPGRAWKDILERYNLVWSNEYRGIQYYYDFLKDLAETYNSVRNLLFDDRTSFNLDIRAFPKHLLLGSIKAHALADENRTRFYPSPITGSRVEGLERVRFLIRKLDTLIRTFQVPEKTDRSVDAPVKAIPSLFEDAPLEERAIPSYYRVDKDHPIDEVWNYQRTAKGEKGMNYGYWSDLARGAAKEPLAFSLGRFRFFRVEGYLGRRARVVVYELKNLIKASNLPFAVRQAVITSDPAKVTDEIAEFRVRHRHLHRLHNLIRQDLICQLNEASKFGEVLKGHAEKSQAHKQYLPHHITLIGRIGEAVRKLTGDYFEYHQHQKSWKEDLSEAIRVYRLRDLVKPELPTPFNSLINTGHIRWLEWLDKLIEQRVKMDRQRIFLSNFVAEHPGAEHFGGVIRGGTFVVLTDESGDAVGDLMLPSIEEEDFEDEIEWPDLTSPDDWSLWRIIHDQDRTPPPPPPPEKQPPFEPRRERLLDELVGGMEAERTRLDKLKEKRGKTGLTPDERDEVRRIEGHLATHIHDIVSHVVTTKADLSANSVAWKALQKAKEHHSAVTTATHRESLAAKLKSVVQSAEKDVHKALELLGWKL